METLVIGSTSTIGRAIAEACAEFGPVEMAGRRQADVFVDLSESNAVPAIDTTYDVVIHAAADFGGAADADIVRAEQVNAIGTLMACRAARTARARHFILISSISAEYLEDHHYFDIYALSKRHSEDLAAFYCRRYNINITILRPTQIYDEADNCSKHQPLFYTIVDRAFVGDDVHIYGTRDTRRNYLFIGDLAFTVSQVAKQSITGTFACAHPDTPSSTEIASTAFDVFKRGGCVRFLADKNDIPHTPSPTDFEIYKRIGYWPTVNLREGLTRIRDFREKGL
ncbi:NAD-dependent epimerase/dehydratase family protein [Dongia soli]|uniref:NAD(P)-dependent oxidoreductase n=1 Tax=Dongia soli TaxID=600628 RepID=A0ABU5ECM3_9PROT|nr:NAD(P)-dependent oxidoreductase [Dongia soli]MDY0884069.1 NAD(P)-dependent oxidoreductase [Dongia soli]